MGIKLAPHMWEENIRHPQRLLLVFGSWWGDARSSGAASWQGSLPPCCFRASKDNTVHRQYFSLTENCYKSVIDLQIGNKKMADTPVSINASLNAFFLHAKLVKHLRMSVQANKMIFPGGQRDVLASVCMHGAKIKSNVSLCQATDTVSRMKLLFWLNGLKTPPNLLYHQ